MSTAPGDSTAAVRADILQAVQRGVLFGVAVLAIVLAPPVPHRFAAAPPASTATAMAPSGMPASPPLELRYAEFGRSKPSPEARHVADWIADSRDNGGAEFIVLDKRYATLYVFDADARLRGATPVLLGAARGDDSVAGIGARPIDMVQVHERTTPAGRFVAERGHNTLGEDVVWVDYAAAVSMHRVRATKPRERRLQRLASKTIADNRISYGCINVPVAFFEAFVGPSVVGRRAIVYVLPEQRSPQQVFGSYDVTAARAVTRLLALRG